MDNFVHVFVLTSLALDKNDEVRSRNVAVTHDLFEAEEHREKGVENDYDTFVVPCDWRDDAATSDLVRTMREFRELIAEQHAEALR